MFKIKSMKNQDFSSIQNLANLNTMKGGKNGK